ncbi:MAG: ketopantoate reductase family protein [Lautropia sp.]
MNIAIIGGGAMGSVYATLLSSAGHAVTIIDRNSEHIAAIERHGLRLEGPLGNRTVRLTATREAPHAVQDLVVLAVKAADVGPAAALARPMLGGQTIVLAMQNGLGSAEVAAAEVGADRLAVGIASGFGASIKAPGHAHHNAMQAIRMGPHAGLAPDALARVAGAWRAAGFDAQAVDDIAAMQWRKLICNVAYSAPCALTGLTVGEVMDDADIGPISRAAAREAWEVAVALGIGIAIDDPVAHVRAFGASVPGAKPSALQDLEAGRPSEIDVINGAVPRYGRQVGVATPVNDTLVALVRQRERHLGPRP